MLWREPMAACRFRRNRARRKGFRYDHPLILRRVDDVLDHGCEPLCARCLACCRSARQAKRWDKKAAYVKKWITSDQQRIGAHLAQGREGRAESRFGASVHDLNFLTDGACCLLNVF